MVKTITAQMSEEKCNVDVNILHETLLELPTKEYIKLYRLMKKQLYDETGGKYEMYNGCNNREID